MKTDVFQNLLDLTTIFYDMFRYEVGFRLLDDEIELSINSIMSCNTYCIKIGYDFKSDDVINKFKDTVISEALNIWKDIS